MAITTSRTVDFAQLKGDEDSAAIMVKLMMCCNDLQLSNESLSTWSKEESRRKKYRKKGAGMYFLRIQISHLFEGFAILEQIKENYHLCSVLEQCDSQTQKSFKKLEPYLKKTSTEKRRLEEIAGRIRSNLTFHYDESNKLIKNAIKDRASRPTARYSSVTRGSETYLWHFKAADDIIDSIVIRQIWKIPRNTDLRKESDKIANEIYDIFLSFMDFSGEFIWKYFSKAG